MSIILPAFSRVTTLSGPIVAHKQAIEERPAQKSIEIRIPNAYNGL